MTAIERVVVDGSIERSLRSRVAAASAIFATPSRRPACRSAYRCFGKPGLSNTLEPEPGHQHVADGPVHGARRRRSTGQRGLDERGLVGQRVATLEVEAVVQVARGVVGGQVVGQCVALEPPPVRRIFCSSSLFSHAYGPLTRL